MWKKLQFGFVVINIDVYKRQKAYLLEEDEIPYSGLYIIPNGEYSLEDLLTEINSEKFKKYIDNVGVCVSGTSKRITPGDIENFYY